MKLVLDGTRAGDGKTQRYVGEFGAQARKRVQECDDALLSDEAAGVGDDDFGVGTAARPLALVAVVSDGRILWGDRVVPHA